jgi:hypothetical protein
MMAVVTGQLTLSHQTRLHHPRLEFIAGAGEHEDEKEIDHVRDDRLGLTNAHGLDEDDVEAGRLRVLWLRTRRGSGSGRPARPNRWVVPTRILAPPPGPEPFLQIGYFELVREHAYRGE